MIRKLTRQDEELYIKLAQEFYHSEAVLHPVDQANIVNTFHELMRSDTYAECYILETEGKTAGFVLIAKTFSQEAGGIVCWIEEIFIRPEFRGKGIATEFFAAYEEMEPVGTKRWRLEIEPGNKKAQALYERRGFHPLPYKQRVRER